MNRIEEFLDYIVQNESKKTVGMILKRIELALEQAEKEGRNYLSEEEIDALKSQIKNVIYEQYRNLRDFIKSGKIILDIIKKEV